MPAQIEKKTKHAEVFDYLRRAIEDGKFRDGDRLPSENELVERFGASRPTVARALRDLQSGGLIDRRVGSGSYVRPRAVATTTGKRFGLLIPDLGTTEIFEPICGQIARQLQAQGHALLWGDCGDSTAPSAVRARQAELACHGCVEQGLAGVFYAPMERTDDEGRASQHILAELAAARIPVVLLDRDTVAFPERSAYDLVALENYRGGYLLAQHLLRLGRRRICFLSRPKSAPTVERRAAGYREAMWQAGLNLEPSWVRQGDPQNVDFIRGLLQEVRPEGIICGNDITAATLLQTLAELGVDVPGAVGVVGFDDVKYARLLRVPLTTIAQPCLDLSTTAVCAMLDRIAHPELPPRTLLLEPTLVVRRSCGAAESRAVL